MGPPWVGAQTVTYGLPTIPMMASLGPLKLGFLRRNQAYAQTGWAKEGNDSVEYVFLQYTDENGDNLVTKYYNASTGQWQGSKATQPPSSKEYNTTWVEGTGGNHQFQFRYDGGTSNNATVSWEPTEWQVMAETLNFDTASPDNEGDHTAGHDSNRIHADDIQKYDTTSGWHNDFSYIHISPEGNHNTDTTGVTNVGYRVWDVRCDS